MMFVTFIIADTVDYQPEMRSYTTQQNVKPTEITKFGGKHHERTD